MKRILALLLAAALLAGAAPPEVTNVRAGQRAGTKLVDITYNLASPDGGVSTIQIELSLDGGLTWRAPVNTLTGAIGENVTAGNNRLPTWNAGVNFETMSITEEASEEMIRATYKVLAWRRHPLSPSSLKHGHRW
ncbi:MAG: hypothetical protein ACJAQT_002959 [Akkermansiaceae bacterium]|jgi:hypothetical protein